MGDLFPTDCDTQECDGRTSLDPRETSCSPVILRNTRQDQSLVTSITSDLTASISSAISNTTLVGEKDLGRAVRIKSDQRSKVGFFFRKEGLNIFLNCNQILLMVLIQNEHNASNKEKMVGAGQIDS